MFLLFFWQGKQNRPETSIIRYFQLVEKSRERHLITNPPQYARFVILNKEPPLKTIKRQNCTKPLYKVVEFCYSSLSEQLNSRVDIIPLSVNIGKKRQLRLSCP